MVRTLGILVIGRRLAIGYARSCGGWEVVETEDGGGEIGFLPEARARLYLSPGMACQSGTFLHLTPGSAGWMAKIETHDGYHVVVNPYRLQPR